MAGKGIKVIQCDVSKDADIENLIEVVEERGKNKKIVLKNQFFFCKKC